MPLAHLHLLHLHPSTPLTPIISTLANASPPPLTLSRVVRWIIAPTDPSLDATTLLHTPWDLLYISLSPSLPDSLTNNSTQILSLYTLQVGIPKRLLEDFAKRNQALLHPNPDNVPKLSSKLHAASQPRMNQHSAQNLELEPALWDWIQRFSASHDSSGSGSAAGRGGVSMLNLLKFKPGKEAKESYLRYGKAFGERIGSSRGGNAKLVGNVVPSAGVSGPASSRTEAKEWAGAKGVGGEGKEDWDEFALAHYPSIEHFADMLASEDYQEVNLRDRVPSLRDTCILCTSEIAVEEILRAQGARGSKL
jgi:hypothetical protein